MNPLEWAKKNKLSALLLLVLAYILWQNRPIALPAKYMGPAYEQETVSGGDMSSFKSNIGIFPPQREFTPTQTQNRLVVQESNLSLVVDNVSEAQEKITDFAKSMGGFMVSSSLTNPEDAAFAQVTVRVPEDKFKNTLSYFRSLAIKVVSENLTGTDVTDEYVDIDARLDTLNKTKAKFEEIMTKATQIQDILQVQREIISLQDQIDALKGRQNYLAQTAKLAKITVYLSTDELALPYAPSDPFRPEVIFKLAIRSLISTLQGVAKALIWIVVYSVIWLPALFIFIAYKKYRGRHTQA